MREQNWERKGPALHVSRYNSSTSALAFEWNSIFLDHWGMDIGGTHTPWNEGHSLSESACRESGTHWWRKHKSILLTHTFQTGNSNLQMRRMLQKKKNQNPNYNSPQKKNFFSRASSTFFFILWSGLWLPEIHIAERQRKKLQWNY